MSLKIKLLNSLRKIFIDQIYTGISTSDLTGKVAIVTGSGRGVGRAVAEVLTNSGATVLGLTRTLDSSSKKIEGFTQIICDLSSEESTTSTIESIIRKHGRIDLLVNNAGIFADGLLIKSSLKQFNETIDCNVKSTYITCKAVLPVMLAQKIGTIINLGSKVSHNSRLEGGKVLYAMSKYAIEGFSYALHRELQGSGVRVICLMPATIHTFFSKQAKKYLSPYDIGEIIKMIMTMKNIDFESILFKSSEQNI